MIAAAVDPAKLAAEIAAVRNQGVTWHATARRFGVTLRAAQEAVAWVESGALDNAPSLARAKAITHAKAKVDPKARARAYRAKYAAIRRERMEAKRERVEAEARAERAAEIATANHHAQSRKFRPKHVIILWPEGAYTPASVCNHGPIKPGSRRYCPICFKSGWDASPLMRLDPRLDPKPEPFFHEDDDDDSATETRRERRCREWMEARDRAMGRGKPAAVA